MVLHDKDIREPLFDFLEETYGKTRVIEEKRMGRSRADIVMVRPNSLTGVEIKSDADTYTRLAGQVRDYDRYFDYNYIVIGSSHAFHVEEHVPDFWGIITVEYVEERVDFYVLKEAKLNEKADLKKQLHFLWRPELAHIQERNGLPAYRKKSKDFVIDKIYQQVPEEKLKCEISDELFERDYNEIAGIIDAYKKGGRS